MLKTLIYLLLIYLVLVLFAYLFQRYLIYFPEQNAPSPAEAGVPEMQVVKITTDDSLHLKAWYRPPQNVNSPTIVYLPGNAGHIGYRAALIEPYLYSGYGVLLVTYRGYSDNPGKPSEHGLYSDGSSAIEFLKQQGVNEKCMVLYGESIGGAVAIELSLKYDFGALILQSPFTSLGAIGQYHYPFLPVKWLVKDNYNSLKKAGRIHLPVLIIHGDNDNIIPRQIVQELYEALPEPKQADYIPHKGHNDLFEPDRVLKFIKQWVKC